MSCDRKSNKKEFCTIEESFQFSQLLGKFNWIASQSHPDIAFGVCMLSSTMKNPKIENVLLAANKLLRKVKAQPLRINFPNLSDLGNIQLICFVMHLWLVYHQEAAQGDTLSLQLHQMVHVVL